MIEGVDYSYDRPTPTGLVAAGKAFAVRYGGLGNPGKHLSAAEVAALRGAGLAIVANVEESANAYRGDAAGIHHATAGAAFFGALGFPAFLPIYFSVDWDAGPDDWLAVDAALRGSASVLGPGRVGVYGSYAVIEHCAAAGTARWFWQTYAWSGGRWSDHAHLQQYRNNVALAGGTVDLTRAVTADFGQWGAGMTFAPASCLAVRHVFQDHTSLPDVSLGIVGDDNHAQTASSYHLGRSANKPSSYTITESARDRNGLSEAASANDIGYFSIDVGGRTHTLRTFSVWLAGQCAAGAPDTADIREVIYSPDGRSVKRWDRLGVRSTGDDSHLSHTHISWFRDSESHDRAAVIRRYFSEIQGQGEDMTFEADQVPVKYPAVNVANPTVAGPWALGSARDLSQETRDLVKALTTTVTLNQKAILAAVTNADDGAAVLAAVQAESAKIRQDLATGEAQDVATAAAIGTAVAELRALRALLEQAGGDPDLAPVMLRLDRLGELVQTSGREAGAEAAKSVIARLRAAQEAEAAALRDEG